MKIATESKQMPYGMTVVKGLKYGVFRVKEGNGALAEIMKKFKPIAEKKFEYWMLSNTVGALKKLPAFTKFRSKFEETKIHFEIAGSVVKGELQEVAVLMVADSNTVLAASRWIKDQGINGKTFFFQNLLSYDGPEPIAAILAPIEAQFREQAPAR